LPPCTIKANKAKKAGHADRKVKAGSHIMTTSNGGTMCYSAQVVADYRKFVRTFGAIIDIHEFARLFFERTEGIGKAKIPKAMEDAFADPQDEATREINALIARFTSAQVTKLEQDLFKQRARLADAERALQTKVTKAATESQRIATDKIAWVKGKLEDLQRTALQPRDSRIGSSSLCGINAALLENLRRTIRSIPEHTMRAGIALKVSGLRALGTRMPCCLSKFSMRTSAGRSTKARYWKLTSVMRTSCWSFVRATGN
jgi:hypothetical protein